LHGRIVIALLTAWLTLGKVGSLAVADGGALRLAERRGDRLIAVFTSPNPVRAGTVDVSVLVQEAASGRPLTNLAIEVRADLPGNEQARDSASATSEAATNKLMQAARLELSDAGRWHVDVIVQGIGPGAPIDFEMEVAEALPPGLALSLWIAWPLAAVALFAAHQTLVYRRRHRSQRITLPLGNRPAGDSAL
jgi:hypothetical protein